MKQNLSLSTRDLAQLKRRERAEPTMYSPILYGDRTVALAKFMPENTALAGWLEMALNEEAENNALPLFYVRHDKNFLRFRVTPGNMRATKYLSSPKTLTKEGLTKLFQYCCNNNT